MKKISTKTKKLETSNNLGDKAREVLTKAFNPLVADAFALYVKTKNYHWHLSGPHFRDFHLLFDEQADQILAMVDVIAERVRKLGGLTIHSISEISKLQRVKDDNSSFVDPLQMIENLYEENNELAARLHDVHKLCEKHQDVATASLLEIFIDETERRVWFLFEILEK